MPQGSYLVGFLGLSSVNVYQKIFMEPAESDRCCCFLSWASQGPSDSSAWKSYKSRQYDVGSESSDQDRYRESEENIERQNLAEGKDGQQEHYRFVDAFYDHGLDHFIRAMAVVGLGPG